MDLVKEAYEIFRDGDAGVPSAQPRGAANGDGDAAALDLRDPLWGTPTGVQVVEGKSPPDSDSLIAVHDINIHDASVDLDLLAMKSVNDSVVHPASLDHMPADAAMQDLHDAGGPKKKRSSQRQRRYRKRKQQEYEDLKKKYKAMHSQWMHALEVNSTLKRREIELSTLARSNDRVQLVFNMERDAKVLVDRSGRDQLPGEGASGGDVHRCLSSCVDNTEPHALLRRIDQFTGSTFRDLLGKLLLECNKRTGAEIPRSEERLRSLLDERNKEIRAASGKIPMGLLTYLSRGCEETCHFQGVAHVVDYLQLTDEQSKHLSNLGQTLRAHWIRSITVLENEKDDWSTHQTVLDRGGLNGLMAAAQRAANGHQKVQQVSQSQTSMLTNLFLKVGHILTPRQNARIAILPGSPLSHACQLCLAMCETTAE